MRAAVRDAWGGPEVVEIVDIPDLEPGPGQVLVRSRAAAVNALDVHRLEGLPYLLRLAGGLRRPRDRFLGADLAGVVESVGDGVTRFSPGDEVMGQSIRTFAEQVVVSEAGLVLKPATVSFDEAAAAQLAGLTALQALTKAGMRPGADVLVLGAAGGVGSLAVQLARALGAGTVTAATRPASLDFVGTLGADAVLDSTTDAVTAAGTRFDVIVDASGVLGYPALRRLLRAGGAASLAGLSPYADRWLAPALRMIGPIPKQRGGTRLVSFLTERTTADLETLAGFLADGSLRPPIDSVSPFERTADALARLRDGGVRGKVVITFA